MSVLLTNLPTIIIAVVVLVIVLIAILSIIKNKNKCSCGCGGCQYSNSCHKRKQNEKKDK